MKHIQFMREAGKLHATQSKHGKITGSHNVRSLVLVKTDEFEKSVARLTEGERETLAAQIHGQLMRERRRCNARASSYDVNGHIRLYLAEKALQMHT